MDVSRLKDLANEALADGPWWTRRELGQALANINNTVEEIDAAEYISALPPQTFLDVVKYIERLEKEIRYITGVDD